MRNFIYSILLFFFVLFSCTTNKKKEVKATNKTNVSLSMTNDSGYKSLDGKSLSLADYKGKKILLNYWATWCRPCIEEMPALERAQLLLEKEDYVVLLAANHTIKEIKDFKSKINSNHNFIQFTGNFSDLNIYALPTTFIFNENGEKITEITGATEWDSPEMIEKLKNIK